MLVVDNYDSFVYTIADYLAQLGADLRCPAQRRGHDRRGRGRTTACCSPRARVRRRRPASAWTWSWPAGRAPSRCSGSASGTRRSARCTAGWSRGRRSCCTARPARSSTPAPGCWPACRRRSPRRATTRWPSRPDTVPAELEITAHTASGIVMALRHRALPLEGVQFHPESVLTQGGHRLLANWLAVCGDAGAVGPLSRPGAPRPQLARAPAVPLRFGRRHRVPGPVSVVRTRIRRPSPVSTARTAAGRGQPVGGAGRGRAGRGGVVVGGARRARRRRSASRSGRA